MMKEYVVNTKEKNIFKTREKAEAFLIQHYLKKQKSTKGPYDSIRKALTSYIVAIRGDKIILESIGEDYTLEYDFKIEFNSDPNLLIEHIQKLHKYIEAFKNKILIEEEKYQKVKKVTLHRFELIEYEYEIVVCIDGDKKNYYSIVMEYEDIADEQRWHEKIQNNVKKVKGYYETKIKGMVEQKTLDTGYMYENWYEVDGVKVKEFAKRASRMRVKILEKK